MIESDLSTFVVRTALSSILNSSSIVALIAGLVLPRRTEQVSGEVRQQVFSAVLQLAAKRRRRRRPSYTSEGSTAEDGGSLRARQRGQRA